VEGARVRFSRPASSLAPKGGPSRKAAPRHESRQPLRGRWTDRRLQTAPVSPFTIPPRPRSSPSCLRSSASLKTTGCTVEYASGNARAGKTRSVSCSVCWPPPSEFGFDVPVVWAPRHSARAPSPRSPEQARPLPPQLACERVRASALNPSFSPPRRPPSSLCSAHHTAHSRPRSARARIRRGSKASEPRATPPDGVGMFPRPNACARHSFERTSAPPGSTRELAAFNFSPAMGPHGSTNSWVSPEGGVFPLESRTPGQLVETLASLIDKTNNKNNLIKNAHPLPLLLMGNEGPIPSAPSAFQPPPRADPLEPLRPLPLE